MSNIITKGIDLEKDIWERTDSTQWVKYLNISDEKRHYFKVVDTLVTEDYCIFGATTILIDSDDLHNGEYNEYIYPYYDSLADVIDLYPNSYMQIIAECIAETDMFTSNSANFKVIKRFDFGNDCEDIDKEVYSKCKEIETFIKEYL